MEAHEGDVVDLDEGVRGRVEGVAAARDLDAGVVPLVAEAPAATETGVLKNARSWWQWEPL